MSWISKFLNATAELEPPEQFFYWSGLSALSAVLRNKVYFDRFSYILRPNIYVFLIAASGVGKGIPVAAARRMVESVNVTRVIAGRNSIQSVLKELGKAYSTPDGKVLDAAHGFLVSGELAAFFVKDPDALTLLTDLYDTWAHESEWKYSLKYGGVDTLKSPCVTLLGATNEEHFPDAVPNNAIGGGFIARTFIVYAKEPRCINDLFDPPKDLLRTYEPELVEYLKEASRLKGPFGLTPKAKNRLRPWNVDVRTANVSDPTGTVRRLLDSVLKVAMLLSLSDSFDLTIHDAHAEEAIVRCTECFAGTRQVTMGAGKSISAPATKLVFKTLIELPEHQITREALLRKHWGDFDALDLDRIVETLIASGAIEVLHPGKSIVYKLKKSTLDAYTNIVTNLTRKEIN